MNEINVPLIAAGAIGGLTAIIHGVLMQRVLIAPAMSTLSGASRAAPTRVTLLVVLLHFTTMNWLLSGVGLIVAATWLGHEARLVAAIFAASSFAYGGIGQLWSLRRFHPGWILMSIALALIAIGLRPQGG